MKAESYFKWFIALTVGGVVLVLIWNAIGFGRNLWVPSDSSGVSLQRDLFICHYDVEADTLWTPRNRPDSMPRIKEAFVEHGYRYASEHGFDRFRTVKDDSLYSFVVVYDTVRCDPQFADDLRHSFKDRSAAHYLREVPDSFRVVLYSGEAKERIILRRRLDSSHSLASPKKVVVYTDSLSE